MAHGKDSGRRNLAIRAVGLLLFVLGALAMRRLCLMVQSQPRHVASIAELGFATLGFVGLSAGSALTFLGIHIFDRIEISARWVPPPAIHPGAVRLSHEELLARFDLRADGQPNSPSFGGPAARASRRLA